MIGGITLRVKNKKQKSRNKLLKNFLKNKSLHRAIICLVTIFLAFLLVESSAAPKRYKLALGEKSNYDIMAPRDIENTMLTAELAEKASDAIAPIMKRLENVPLDVLNKTDEFINVIKNCRQSVDKNLQEQGISERNRNYNEILALEQEKAVKELEQRKTEYGVSLSGEQVNYLITEMSNDELEAFDKITREYVSSIMKEDIDAGNLAGKINLLQKMYRDSELPQELKNIGSGMAEVFLVPNSVVDQEKTDEKKAEAYNAAMENKQIIQEGTRILSYGDIVTQDKLEVLKELDLLETGKPDYAFAGGILAVIILLAATLILYMIFFCRDLLSSRKNSILISAAVLLVLLIAWIICPLNPYLIPVFMIPMLISILLDIRLGVVINLLVSLAIAFMTGGNQAFLYASVIGGTFAAFVVSGANQRSRISISGVAVAIVNAIVVACIGLINKSALMSIAEKALFVSVNGMLSTILTIGTLPFFESVFNIITPLKLLELSNPNHPLIKRLLLEAPGTYHHSLMVGNLAEVATEAINGNALLARVGAYYHDVGKLKRPSFFKENQISDNPHDKMSPSLSTLIITSHTSDGVEIAEKYKIPEAIRDIISQHHGNTLVAYFYYKAKKADKDDIIKQEDFRYQCSRPTSKEAAVVMLADSVEAAVRAMPDKTEGKIEGLVRKIIKDKLDDGQLDLCDLTLKDLDTVARSFMRVFDGYFHERTEYPEIKKPRVIDENDTYESEVKNIDTDVQIFKQENDNYGSESEKGNVKNEKAKA
jgi:hypothetical protein